MKRNYRVKSLQFDSLIFRHLSLLRHIFLSRNGTPIDSDLESTFPPSVSTNPLYLTKLTVDAILWGCREQSFKFYFNFSNMYANVSLFAEEFSYLILTWGSASFHFMPKTFQRSALNHFSRRREPASSPSSLNSSVCLIKVLASSSHVFFRAPWESAGGPLDAFLTSLSLEQIHTVSSALLNADWKTLFTSLAPYTSWHTGSFSSSSKRLATPSASRLSITFVWRNYLISSSDGRRAATAPSSGSLATRFPASLYPLSWRLWNNEFDGSGAIPV